VRPRGAFVSKVRLNAKEGNAMNRLLRTTVLAAICLLLACFAVPAQEPGGGGAASGPAALAVHVDRWLLLGPFQSPIPAFTAEDRDTFGAANLLSYEEIPLAGLAPADGASSTLLLDEKGIWKSAPADTGGLDLAPDTREPAIAYLAAYVEVPRWMKTSVSIRSSAPFRAWIDGIEIVKNDKDGGFGSPKSGDAKLEEGTHLLLVKTVRVPFSSVAVWRLDATVSGEGKDAVPPAVSVSPTRNLSLADILYIQQISGTAVSPDGALVAITTGKYSREREKYESWIEIRNLEDGSLVRTIKDTERMGSLQWAPTGRRLSYRVSADKDASTLRLLDLDAGTCATIVEDVKNLGGYQWGRTGRFIVYTVTEKAEPDKRGVQHLTNIEERQAGGDDRSSLYVTTVPEGETRRLTAGPHNTGIYDTHPDGKRILISRSYEDLSRRPYSTTELLIMNLEDQSVELLWKGPWLASASFSPDGATILVEAGPSSFGPIGVNVPEGTIPNDYDGQLYLFDVATKKVEPLTRDFDPAVTGAIWSKVDGDIYLTAEDGAYISLYRLDPRKRSFTKLDTGAETMTNLDLAFGKLRAVCVGSGATAPPRLYALDLARGKSRMIDDPNASDFADIVQGAVEPWSFTSSSGVSIDGYVYLPPGFDPQKKYPCIVYYYGGTSPTTRFYGGRYPKNLWAAEGYVVYVLQPSGATGYGQTFSAYHVNDWGKIVAGEIIEGTKKFVEAHPFVDGSRLGCIGASYGGFMTELLMTKTDIFAAAISHAGISSIASYWGEGYWGYSYNAVAAANSFPWNRRDIYVEQSPLFSADKITTPLLLLHGTEDTNVPTGESEQLFTALKLLGRTVEYVRIEGQNHAIMDFKKRDIWSRTILAWFDRFLKNEPAWWSDLYPPSGGSAAADTTGGAGGSGAAATAPGGAGAEAPEPASIGVKVVEKPDGSKVVLGNVTREDIDSNIAGWDAEYFDYKPDPAVLGELAGRLDGVSFVVVLGTWCSDSHREVPRLWRVLDAIGLSPDETRTFAVEHANASPGGALTQDLIDWSKNVRDYYHITAVESIIVYRGGVELGRIVEAPTKSIEADLLAILSR
jgi:dipeptidyl aminopeptidase/acylaminoacyl peptidase